MRLQADAVALPLPDDAKTIEMADDTEFGLAAI